VAWESLLTDLYGRGLRGRGLTMIGTDGGAGLLAALATVCPQIAAQRCWAHKTRSILEKVRLCNRAVAKRDLHRITHAANLRVARGAARRFADCWPERYPLAVACLQADLEDLLLFFRLDDPEWRKAARTTNAIERRFREVRCRTRPMGVFSDRTSEQRIPFAVFTHENRREGIGTLILLTQKT
jgi:putative transposase